VGNSAKQAVSNLGSRPRGFDSQEAVGKEVGLRATRLNECPKP